MSEAVPGTKTTNSLELAGSTGLTTAKPPSSNAPLATKPSSATPSSSVAATVTVTVSPRRTSVTPPSTAMLTSGRFRSSTASSISATGETLPAPSSERATSVTGSAVLASAGIAIWNVSSKLPAGGETTRLSRNVTAPVASRPTFASPTSSLASTRTSRVSPGMATEPSGGLAISTVGGVASVTSTETETGGLDCPRLSVAAAANVSVPSGVAAGTSTSKGTVTLGTGVISPPTDAVVTPLSAPSTRVMATSSFALISRRTVVPFDTVVPGAGCVMATAGGSSSSKPTGIGATNAPIFPDESIGRTTSSTGASGIVRYTVNSRGAVGLVATSTSTPST